MKKEPISLDKVLPTSWEEHPACQWAIQNARNILWGLLALVTLLILLYTFLVPRASQAEANYASAEKEFHQFSIAQDPTVAAASLEKLQGILKQHPELHQKYDGLLAQALINKGKGNEASGYAESVFSRTQNEDDPLYTEYSSSAILIAENQFQKALERSLDLQQKLEKNPENYLVLTAYNLLRIASLQAELGLKTEEKATWKKWRDLVSNNNNPALKQLIDAYAVDGISLANYIEMREAALSN